MNVIFLYLSKEFLIIKLVNYIYFSQLKGVLVIIKYNLNFKQTKHTNLQNTHLFVTTDTKKKKMKFPQANLSLYEKKLTAFSQILKTSIQNDIKKKSLKSTRKYKLPKITHIDWKTFEIKNAAKPYEKTKNL